MPETNNEPIEPADVRSMGSIWKSIERNKLSYVLDDKINPTNAQINQTIIDILYLKKQMTE